MNLENKDLVGGVPYTGFVGNFPPVQAVNPDLLTHVPGVVSGGVSNFPQVQKTAFPATYYTGKFSFPSFPNDLGVQYTGVPSRTLPGFQGYQGVATVKNLQTHQGNLGLPQLSGTSYNVFSQEPLTGFVPQGLNPQAVAVAPEPATVPAYTRNVLTQTPTTVFPTNQGVLKYPVTGVTHAAFNVPQLPTKNVPTDPSGRVFVRS